jgi:hypothetical protein
VVSVPLGTVEPAKLDTNLRNFFTDDPKFLWRHWILKVHLDDTELQNQIVTSLPNAADIGFSIPRIESCEESSDVHFGLRPQFEVINYRRHSKLGLIA